MLLTTTPTVEGRPIQQYIGIVTAEAIIGANIVKDIFAGIRDIVGGRSGTYEKVIEEARMNALRELEEKAMRMGANAVVGIDLDFETVGSGGSMLMVVATGTATQLGEIAPAKQPAIIPIQFGIIIKTYNRKKTEAGKGFAVLIQAAVLSGSIPIEAEGDHAGICPAEE